MRGAAVERLVQIAAGEPAPSTNTGLPNIDGTITPALGGGGSGGGRGVPFGLPIGPELHFAGPHDDAIRKLAANDGVQVRGFVEDLPGLLASSRLVLAPLWSGGGFRVKNATSLLHGLPIVTNELGARGCRAPEPAGVVREDADGLADAAIALLDSRDRAREAGAQARRWAVQHYAMETAAKLQLERIEALLRRGR